MLQRRPNTAKSISKLILKINSIGDSSSPVPENSSPACPLALQVSGRLEFQILKTNWECVTPSQRASSMAQQLKKEKEKKNSSRSARDAGDMDSIPGSGRSLEKRMATYSSILAWRIPWIEESGGLRPTGLQRVGHDWSDLACKIQWTGISIFPQANYKWVVRKADFRKAVFIYHFTSKNWRKRITSQTAPFKGKETEAKEASPMTRSKNL